MEILDGIEIVDLALYIKKSNTLVFSDVHLGYEEALTKQGILVPKFHFKDLVRRIERILSRVRCDTIVINGDLKHEFGTISDEEWRNIRKFMALLRKNCKRLVIMKGNHDKIIDPIGRELGFKPVKEYITDDVMITHGDFIPDVKKEVKTIIIGHEHPAVTLREGAKSEKYKCFLLGKWKRKNLIVLPSLNLVTEGTDVVSERLLSPFLDQDLGKFKVWIIADKTYEFGELKRLL